MGFVLDLATWWQWAACFLFIFQEDLHNCLSWNYTALREVTSYNKKCYVEAAEIPVYISLKMH